MNFGSGNLQKGLEADIRVILNEIKDPCSVAASVPMGLEEMGLVKAIDVSADGYVSIELRLTSPFCEMIAYFKNEVIARLLKIQAVSGVSVTHDSGLDWTPDDITPAAQARRQNRLDRLYGLPTANKQDLIHPG